MKSIHIRQIDEDTLEKLKYRARLHRRSLQKEIETLLEDAARMIPSVSAESPLLEQLHTVTTGKSQTDWSREELYGPDGR